MKNLTDSSAVELSFTVPLVPPSVNHYKVKNPQGRGYHLTPEAIAFKAAVAIIAQGRSVFATEYELEVAVYFGKGGKGDGDNLWKCLADGLKDAGVIHSDAAVKRWVLDLGRDWENPRTEITVRAL